MYFLLGSDITTISYGYYYNKYYLILSLKIIETKIFSVTIKLLPSMKLTNSITLTKLYVEQVTTINHLLSRSNLCL